MLCRCRNAAQGAASARSPLCSPPLQRPTKVRVKAQDLTGKKFTLNLRWAAGKAAMPAQSGFGPIAGPIAKLRAPPPTPPPPPPPYCSGFPARIFQHEYDHLDGRLFHDRMQAEVLQGVKQQVRARPPPAPALPCPALPCKRAALTRKADSWPHPALPPAQT
jgi:hypothetical protein